MIEINYATIIQKKQMGFQLRPSLVKNLTNYFKKKKRLIHLSLSCFHAYFHQVAMNLWTVALPYRNLLYGARSWKQTVY